MRKFSWHQFLYKAWGSWEQVRPLKEADVDWKVVKVKGQQNLKTLKGGHGVRDFSDLLMLRFSLVVSSFLTSGCPGAVASTLSLPPFDELQRCQNVFHPFCQNWQLVAGSWHCITGIAGITGFEEMSGRDCQEILHWMSAATSNLNLISLLLEKRPLWRRRRKLTTLQHNSNNNNVDNDNNDNSVAEKSWDGVWRN